MSSSLLLFVSRILGSDYSTYICFRMTISSVLLVFLLKFIPDCFVFKLKVGLTVDETGESRSSTLMIDSYSLFFCSMVATLSEVGEGKGLLLMDFELF